MKSYSITILLSLLLLVSCKPEPLDIVIKPSAQKPTLFNLTAPDGLMGMLVTRSFEAGHKPVWQDESGLHIDNRILLKKAGIRIFNAEEEYHFTEAGQGIYYQQWAGLQNGHLYQLEMRHPDYEMVQASEVKMRKVEFDSTGLASGNNKMHNLYLSFTDIPDEKNYYVIQFLRSDLGKELPDFKNPDAMARLLFDHENDFELIREEDLKNGKFILQKQVRTNQADSMVVSLSNISKGYFEYLQQMKRAGSPYNQLRGEVVNVKGNIRNGYGYFSLHEPDVRLLHIIR